MANVPQNLSFGVPHESFESNVTVVDSKQRSNPFDVVISQKSLSYIILLLSDVKKEVNLENVNNLLDASNLDIDPIFVKGFVDSMNYIKTGEIIDKQSNSFRTSGTLTENIEASETRKPEEVQKDESPEESGDDMGFGLFD
jgi:ribosomal protein L12E/L44/L45/RPP1/RPP2